MAGRQVAKCDQKSFWATSFGQKYVYLSPKDLSLGDQLWIYACTLITELCQCKVVVPVCNSFYDLAIVGAAKLLYHLPISVTSLRYRLLMCCQIMHNNYQSESWHKPICKIISSVNNHFISSSLCVLHLCQSIFMYYLWHAHIGIYKLSIGLYLCTLSVICD